MFSRWSTRRKRIIFMLEYGDSLAVENAACDGAIVQPSNDR